MKSANNIFESERGRFPLTERFAYLDHASRGPLSPPAFEAIERVTREMQNVHPDQHKSMNPSFREARKAMADLIGAPEGSICLVPNTSSGIALAAGSLSIEPGENVILGRGEFPANVFPWLNLRRKGVEIRFLERPIGGPGVDLLRSIMDEKTRAVSLSWVGFCDGARIDTQKIGTLCAEKGVFFVVDGIQGTGALKADLTAVDMWVCGGGKWTLAPQGGGFCYIRPALIEMLQPDRVGWLSVAQYADLENLHDLTNYCFDLAPDARRAETGSNSLLTQLALGASCRYLHELDVAAVEARIHELCDYLVEGLARQGLKPLLGPKTRLRSGIVCIPVPDAPGLAKRLVERGVIVSAREGRIRAGIHFYNNFEDLDRLLAGLRDPL